MSISQSTRQWLRNDPPAALKPRTLQDWIDQSPNRSANNTLIKGIGTKNGKPVYHYYYWNLKPVDPNEPSVCTLPDGTVITTEQAHALL